MGSSLDRHGNALDQERAASMADEGGAAGAIMDTREQFAAVAPSRPVVGGSRLWPLAVAFTGSALLAAALIAGYRRRHASADFC
jgi:hypothetical protein